MKKTVIKGLSAMLAVVLTLTAAPLSGFVGLELPTLLDFSIMSKAATSGTCGTNVTWEFDEETGTLTISGTGAMDDFGYDYWYEQCPWENYRGTIKKLIIENGITKVGDYSFYRCYNIKSITIPNSVISVGDYVFKECYSLENIIIPNRITTIGTEAFGSCSRLTNIEIPNSVITIGKSAFAGCDSLISINIPDSVTTIGDSAFGGCDSLTIITVDDNNQYYSNDENGVLFNKDKTTLIQYPMGNTRTSYTIPDSVTTIGNYAFYDCDNLTSVEIPDSVTVFGVGAFSDCDNLTSVEIPDSVTVLGVGAFEGCRNLTSINIPDSVTLIDSDVFCWCESLTNIEIPDSVTSIGLRAFYRTENLTSVSIPNSVTRINRLAFESSGITKIIIPESIDVIEYDVFDACNSLTDVYYTGTEEQWKKMIIRTGNDPLLNATIHYNYCEHDYVDGTCTECGRNKPITQEISSQIRFNRNADGSYAETFDVRTRAMISDEDFKSLVGATDTEAIKNIDKIGFVYTINGENFSAESAQAVAQGETVSGYVDAPVKYVQNAGEYYMFTCLVTDIPATDRNYTLTAYAYICVNGKWYFSEEPMNADFNALYEKNYPIACEKYGWEV